MVPLGDTPYVNMDQYVFTDETPVAQSANWGAARLCVYLYKQIMQGINNLGRLIGRIHSFATSVFTCIQKEKELQSMSDLPFLVDSDEEQIVIQCLNNQPNLSYLFSDDNREAQQAQVFVVQTTSIDSECFELTSTEEYDSNDGFLNTDSNSEEENDQSTVNVGTELKLLDVNEIECVQYTGEMNSDNSINIDIEDSIQTSFQKEMMSSELINSTSFDYQDNLVSVQDGQGPFSDLDEDIVGPCNQEQITQSQSLRKEQRIFKMFVETQGGTPPLDTLTLSLYERLEWRKARFENRRQLALLTPPERQVIEKRHFDRLAAIENMISHEMERFNIELSEVAKGEMISKVAQHYLLTMQYYSPAIILWIDSLLLHARESNKKLVFLARDGIVFHDVAKILLEKESEKYSGYPADHLIVAWLSRKSSKDLESRGDLAQRYLKQLGIDEHEPIILVDTGVTGSIKRSLSKIVNNDLEAQFSLSRNPAIYGFWDNSDFTIQAIALILLPPTHQDSWVNDPQNANRWLEDTHRGNFVGAERFEDDCESGTIYPVPSMKMEDNQVILNEVAVESESDLSDFLIREFGRRAITDFALDANPEELDYDDIKRNLNDLLTRIQKGEASIPAWTHD